MCYAFRFVLLYLIRNCSDEFTKDGVVLPSSCNEFDSLVYQYEDNLRSYLINSFTQIGVDPFREITFENFSNWVTKDHSLEITYHNKTFKIAMSVMCLNDIELIEDQN